MIAIEGIYILATEEYEKELYAICSELAERLSLNHHYASIFDLKVICEQHEVTLVLPECVRDSLIAHKEYGWGLSDIMDIREEYFWKYGNTYAKYEMPPAIRHSDRYSLFMREKEKPMNKIDKSKLRNVANEGVCIKSVETYNDRVVLVRFSDGSFTKAVCSPNDTFDLDTGITICMVKRMLGNEGTKRYNYILKQAHSIIDRQEKEKEQKAREKVERRERQRKFEEAHRKYVRQAKNEWTDIIAEGIKAGMKMATEEKDDGAAQG